VIKFRKSLLYITSSIFRFLSIKLLILMIPLLVVGNTELIIAELLLMLLFMIILPGIEICIYLLVSSARRQKWLCMSFRILELVYYISYVILIFNYI